MATKPTISVKWADGASALKINTSIKQQDWGWTTSNNTITGTPEKPILQYENGWRYAVWQWVKYLDEKTTEIAPPATGKDGQFLSLNGSTYEWNSPFPTSVAGDVTGNKTIKVTAATDDPTRAVLQWGYPWQDPGATTDGNPLRFSYNSGGYLWQTAFPAFAGNGSKSLKLNSGATAVEWATSYEVPTPGGSGLILQANGSSAGSFAWVSPSFSASVITSGTVDTMRLPIYQGASAVAVGVAGVVPPAPIGGQGRFLTGGGTWAQISEVPPQTLQGGKFLTTNGTTASWAENYSVPTAGSAGMVLKSTGTSAGAYAFQFSYEVPTPGGAGLILESSGSSAGAYAWANPSFTADKIIGGTNGQVLVSNGTNATWSALTATQIPSLDAAKITTGTFAAAQIPSLDAAKITTGTFLASQIPSLDAAKITTGTLAGARVGAFTGATSGAAGSLGGVAAPAAGDQGKFLRGDATWQALQVAGMLTSATSGTQQLDFTAWNTVSCLAISGSITFTFTGLSGGRILTIVLKTASGTQNIVWPAGIKWADGLPLTAATATPSTVTLVAYGPAATDVYATAIRTYS